MPGLLVELSLAHSCQTAAVGLSFAVGGGSSAAFASAPDHEDAYMMRVFKKSTSLQYSNCQMPNAKCQMPNAKCQMPNVQKSAPKVGQNADCTCACNCLTCSNNDWFCFESFALSSDASFTCPPPADAIHFYSGANATKPMQMQIQIQTQMQMRMQNAKCNMQMHTVNKHIEQLPSKPNLTLQRSIRFAALPSHTLDLCFSGSYAFFEHSSLSSQDI